MIWTSLTKQIPTWISASLPLLCLAAWSQEQARGIPQGVVGGAERTAVSSAQDNRAVEEINIRWRPEEMRGLSHPYSWQVGNNRILLAFPPGRRDLRFRIFLTVGPDGVPTIATLIKSPDLPSSWANWAEDHSMLIRFTPRKINGIPKYAEVVISFQVKLREESHGDQVIGFLDILPPDIESICTPPQKPHETPPK